MGRDHTLQFYWSSTGKTWHRTRVAGAGTTFSGPSLAATSGSGAFIAAEGARHTLQFYWLTAGRWHRTQIGGDRSAYGAPSLAQGQGRCNGAPSHRRCSGPRLPAVAVQGAGHSLWYYWLTTAGWHRHEVLAAGHDYSAPSLVIRWAGQAAAAEGTGTADIAVEGPAQELYYLVSADGGLRWTGTAAASFYPGSAMAAPSLIVTGGRGGWKGVATAAVETPQGWQEFAYPMPNTGAARPGSALPSATRPRRWPGRRRPTTPAACSWRPGTCPFAPPALHDRRRPARGHPDRGRRRDVLRPGAGIMGFRRGHPRGGAVPGSAQYPALRVHSHVRQRRACATVSRHDRGSRHDIRRMKTGLGTAA
jgi:hypothetical protein